MSLVPNPKSEQFISPPKLTTLFHLQERGDDCMLHIFVMDNNVKHVRVLAMGRTFRDRVLTPKTYLFVPSVGARR